jgi:hypothetical protein
VENSGDLHSDGQNADGGSGNEYEALLRLPVNISCFTNKVFFLYSIPNCDF